jgi:hypothetical protein
MSSLLPTSAHDIEVSCMSPKARWNIREEPLMVSETISHLLHVHVQFLIPHWNRKTAPQSIRKPPAQV